MPLQFLLKSFFSKKNGFHVCRKYIIMWPIKAYQIDINVFFAATPKANNTLIFGFPVLPWVSCLQVLDLHLSEGFLASISSGVMHDNQTLKCSTLIAQFILCATCKQFQIILISGLKNGEFQLVLQPSSNHILLARGQFLLILVHDFLRG